MTKTGGFRGALGALRRCTVVREGLAVRGAARRSGGGCAAAGSTTAVRPGAVRALRGRLCAPERVRRATRVPIPMAAKAMVPASATINATVLGRDLAQREPTPNAFMR